MVQVRAFRNRDPDPDGARLGGAAGDLPSFRNLRKIAPTGTGNHYPGPFLAEPGYPLHRSIHTVERW